MSKYICELQGRSLSETPQSLIPLQFWQQPNIKYDKLKPIAEDLIGAPASQAYVERIFSVCGMLTTGRRNRMNKSLEMRACLKLNNAVLKQANLLM
jgi:hypothetical protein